MLTALLLAASLAAPADFDRLAATLGGKWTFALTRGATKGTATTDCRRVEPGLDCLLVGKIGTVPWELPLRFLAGGQVERGVRLRTKLGGLDREHACRWSSAALVCDAVAFGALVADLSWSFVAGPTFALTTVEHGRPVTIRGIGKRRR